MNHREEAQLLLSKLYRAQAAELCQAGIAVADLGAGIAMMTALASETTKSRSVVMVVCGPIPDDLVESLGQYCRSLSQDLKTSGTIKTIYEG